MEKKEAFNSDVWEEEEVERLIDAQKKGLKWDGVARVVGTRSRKQCISFWQKYRGRLRRFLRANASRRAVMLRTGHRIDLEILASMEAEADKQDPAADNQLTSMALGQDEGGVGFSAGSPNDVELDSSLFASLLEMLDPNMPCNESIDRNLFAGFSAATGDLGAHGDANGLPTGWLGGCAESS